MPWWAVLACDGGRADGVDSGIPGVCAEAPATLDLTGPWRAELRRRIGGADFGPVIPLGTVAVPGWLFPFGRFPSEDAEVELTYYTELRWPWSCAPPPGARVVLEADAVDYEAVFEVDGVVLGTHRGGPAAVAVAVAWGTEGTLGIRLRDHVRGVEALGGIEAYPRATLQGADTGGWGMNAVGLPGPLRLRRVGPVRLRGAYAAADTDGVTRVGVWLEPPDAGGARLQVRPIAADGHLGATSEAVLTPDEHGQAWVGVSLGMVDAAQVEVALFVEGQASDRRTLGFRPSRLSLGAQGLTLDGSPHFARGAAIHHLYRGLGLEALDVVDPYVALDAAQIDRYRAALAATAGVGVKWIRPAHLVPDPAFLAEVHAAGFLVYQDFPLLWNTDFEALPPEEIIEQFRGFIWRVAAEPAVAAVAMHNEAELGDAEESALATSQALIDRLLQITGEVAPHLIRIGCSGCRGTAGFPPRPAWPTQDQLIDVHGYPGSWWNPTAGYGDLRAVVEGLAAGDRPVWWSELGNGWTLHFAYLVALRDTLTPMSPPELVAARREIERWLVGPDGTPVSLGTFYAGTWCRIVRRVAVGDLAACAAAERARQSDAELIAWARRHYFADRWAVEGSPADPYTGGPLVAAHWLATQVFEARWLRGAMVGTLVWQRTENGFPFEGLEDRWSPEVVARARAIIASAHAEIAARMEVVADGGVEVRLVNDGGERTVDASLWVGDRRLWGDRVRVAPRTHSLQVPAGLVAPLAGQVLRLELRLEGHPLGEARVLNVP